jgi:hypothetical protein
MPVMITRSSKTLTELWEIQNLKDQRFVKIKQEAQGPYRSPEYHPKILKFTILAKDYILFQNSNTTKDVIYMIYSFTLHTIFGPALGAKPLPRG